MESLKARENEENDEKIFKAQRIYDHLHVEPWRHYTLIPSTREEELKSEGMPFSQIVAQIINY